MQEVFNEDKDIVSLQFHPYNNIEYILGNGSICSQLWKKSQHLFSTPSKLVYIKSRNQSYERDRIKFQTVIEISSRSFIYYAPVEIKTQTYPIVYSIIRLIST